MDKKKEKILVIILVIVVILTSSFIIFNVYSVKMKNKEKLLNADISGKWITESSQVFMDDNIVASSESDNDSYINLENGKITICYKNNDDYVCYDCNYIIKKNKIIIDENDTFLSGENEFAFENGFLVLKYSLGSKKNYAQIVFTR